MSAPNRNTKEQHGHGLRRYQRERPSAGRSPPVVRRSAPHRIEEQQPIMRSVAVNPAARHQRTLHIEPALGRIDPTGGLFPPPGPIRRVSQRDLPKEGKHRQKLPGRSKSESALVTKWHVEHATLQTRSADFPVLKTARTVVNTPAHVISSRLANCLQARSIKTRYSKSEENIAKCRNIDFCKFTVRLYSGDEGGVLVEVQRLCGDCISFMRDCRALLDAADGKAQESYPGDDEPFYLRLPVSEMAFVKTASISPVTQEEEAKSLNVTADLLSSPQSDTNMLGMESLVIQSDPLKTLKSTAILASRRILCPSDPGNIPFNLHNYIMSLLIYGNEEESQSHDPETDSPYGALGDHSMKLRNLALSALHNALSLLVTEKLLLSVISSDHEWYTTVLIPKLLQDLKKSSIEPHDACYASRCLSKFAESSVKFASIMKGMGGLDALKSAEEVGMREFALLAMDASQCHNVLTCCV